MAYLAASLKKLRSEVDGRWPNRDKASDGWIGDANHTYGDHLPDPQTGVVRALDIDASDIDAMTVVRGVIAHPSTEYVIHNRLIWLRSSAFRARTYTGVNPHTTHVHVSIRHTDTAEESQRRWLPPAEEDDMPDPRITDQMIKEFRSAVNYWRLHGERQAVLDARFEEMNRKLEEINSKLDALTPPTPGGQP